MFLSQKKQKKGFTLVETLVVIFIFSIIMIGTTLLLRNILKNSKQQTLALDVVDQARIVIFNFTNELRNATAGNDGSYPLNQTGDSQIILYTMYGSAANTKVNRLRYYVSGTTLYKGVIVPSGNPLTYNISSEVSTAIISNLANASTPVFRYYDGNYAGTSTPLTQPINVNTVKFVAINLILPTQDARESTTTFTITAGGTIRNIKTNLGN
jgi:prepilin-type N-terminal cleavage/methylation domain-containing protein